MKNTQASQLDGIGFVTNAQGQQVAVLIDLREHGALWEDFYDTLLSRTRADEPRESLEEVREQLKSLRKLDG